MRVKHEIPPLYDEKSRVLILGSLPSVKSRQENFYYANKKNRFWRILSQVFSEEEPLTIEEKKALILDHQLALWDVVASCEIDGSKDSSIKDVQANPVWEIVDRSRIDKIFTTGRKAQDLYEKMIYERTGIHALYLPSTSPANGQFKDKDLLKAYDQIRKALEE